MPIPNGRLLIRTRLREQILTLTGMQLTSAEIRARFNSKRSTTGTVLRLMVAAGEAERNGERRGATWRIIGPDGDAGGETSYQKRRKLAEWPSLEEWELIERVTLTAI